LKNQKRELVLVKGQLTKVQIENHNLSMRVIQKDMRVIQKEQVQRRQKICNKNKMTLTNSIGRLGMT
jgi:hypothetical protein